MLSKKGDRSCLSGVHERGIVTERHHQHIQCEVIELSAMVMMVSVLSGRLATSHGVAIENLMCG